MTQQVRHLALLAVLVGGTFQQFAVAQAIVVDGTLTREAVASPGGRVEGTINLRNLSDDPWTVRVYQTDYRFVADGRSWYDELGKLPRSNGHWTVCAPHTLTVAPQGATPVTYTVQVPDDPTLVGTFWSVIMVEPQGPDEPVPQEEQGKVKVGLRTVVRYAIQVVTHIDDTGTRELKFTDKQVTAEEGKRLLLLDAENSGERSLAPTVWAEVYDAEGTFVGRFEGAKMRIHPGCSRRFTVDLTSLQPGKYEALVVADNGDDYVFGARYTLELE